MKKLLLGLILGAAAGSGITYIVMKKKIDDITRWEYEEDLDVEFMDPDLEDEGEVLINPQPELQISEGARTQEQYIRYNTKYSGKKSDEKEEASMSQEELNDAEGKRLTEEAEEIGDDIFIIDADEFGTKPQFDTSTLMYYTHDGVLTTEDEEIIDDIEGTIGEECVDALDAGGADSVFVRNGRLATEYEVIRVTAAYNE